VGKDLVGLARITSSPYPDPKLKDPKIVVIDLEAVRRLPTPVPLASIKADPGFAGLGLVRMSRLSVIPVPEDQWKKLLAMGGVSREKS
jgi:predicted RNA-binding protein with PUA-like domain